MWRSLLVLSFGPGISLLLKWGSLTCILGVMVGSACAGFLWSLDQVTRFQFDHPELLWLLPFAGAVVGWLYLRFGQSVASGNNLIIEQLQQPGEGVPLRIAPLVLIGTLLTHLCGGSAGREGTAVQIGCGFAGGLARMIPGLSQLELRILLMAGVAAGFGGVFGTPVAGVVFALEVAVLGRIEKQAILPCLVAALVSDQTCAAWGVGHTSYAVASLIPAEATFPLTPLSTRLLVGATLGGLLFGLAARLCVGLTHGIQSIFNQRIPNPILRPVVGGCGIIAMVYLIDTRNYLGLGVISPDPAAATIVNAFHSGGVNAWSWWWKILFTAVTLGSGFKGGEATPLFFIGAALGNTLASPLGVPIDFCVALGFVSVFAGATHTPFACTVMAVELFGGESFLYYAISCFMAHQVSGRGVYSTQQARNPAMDSQPE